MQTPRLFFRTCFRDRSIVFKLLLIFLLTVVLPILGISLVSYQNQLAMVRREIQQSASELTRNINAGVADWYDKMNSITSLLYSTNLLPILERGQAGTQVDSYTQLQDNNEMKKFFEYLLNQNEDIQNIYIFTPRQDYYTTYNGRLKANYRPEEEAWYSAAKEKKGKILLFSPHKPWPLFASNEMVFSMAREIHSLDNRFLGVLLIDLKAEALQQIVGRFYNSYGTEFFIFDAQDDNLLYQSTEEVLYADPGVQREILQAIPPQQEAGYRTLGGERVLLTYSADAASPFRIVGVTPAARINRVLQPLVTTNILLFAASAILFALCLQLLYMTLVKPIYRLNRSMQQAVAQQFQVRVQADSRDEIGQLCMSFNEMVGEIGRLINREYKLALLQKDAEFSALQAQIHPHFLYNTLQLISSMAIVKKVPEISQVTQALGYMLRFSIRAESTLVPMQEELRHVESYLFIQKVRMEGAVQVVKQINPLALQHNIMKLTIQPFLENAFQHGLADKRGTGMLSLVVDVYDRICIEIYDNGRGMTAQELDTLLHALRTPDYKPDSGRGIGIYNVNARLRLIYQNRYDLSIVSRPGEGTCVTLHIPVAGADKPERREICEPDSDCR